MEGLFFAVGAAGTGEIIWSYFYVAESITRDCVHMTFALTLQSFFFCFPSNLLCRVQQSIKFHILR